METITYVGGCGRLGLAFAAWSAECGYEVYATDINEEMVNAVNLGKVDTMEPQVAELVAKHAGKNLKARMDTPSCAARSEMIFVIVPTPSKHRGDFDISYVLDACKEIGEGIKDVVSPQDVIIVSTVNPGDTDGPIRECLEKHSGRKVCYGDISLIYSPQLIRQGSIIHDFANPDLLLMGAAASSKGDEDMIHMYPVPRSALSEYYGRVIEGELVSNYVMSAASAEIAKIGLNAAVVTKLSFAGQLMWLCHYMPGADARDVLGAIGADPRIGHKYFNPGLWSGGPCFPRDCRALSSAIGKHSGTNSAIADASSASLWGQRLDLCMLINGYPGRIGVLGLTYKTGVDITEESPGLQVALTLSGSGYRRDVIAYDPSAEPVLNLTVANSLERCVEMADVLVITTPWPEFKALEEMDLSATTVIDCWGMLSPELNCKQYIRLGKGVK